MTDRHPWTRSATHPLLAVGVVIVLYLIYRRNYLLFHGLVEVFSILVAFAVFIIAWNARFELDSPVLAILGIGYLFVGGLDLLHTFAYKGMGVFPGAGADLPTQLWIFARYLEAASLLGAAVVGYVALRRNLRDIQWGKRAMPTLMLGYAGVVALGLAAIFVFDVFPRAYIAGQGLTAFKINSEYLIIVGLLVALALFAAQRRTFDRRVFELFAVAIVLSTGAELAFTAYVNVYGLSNAIGHFFKVGSFYLIYLGVVRTGFVDPQKALYRELAQREAEARKFEKAVEHSGHSVLITDPNGIIQYVNPAFEAVTGYDSDEVVGKRPTVLKSGEHGEAFYAEMWNTILDGRVWESEIVNTRKTGEQFVVNQTIAPITDEDGTVQHLVGVHKDISERKKQEQELLQRYEALFNSIRDAILVADTDRRITNANPAFTELFGYDLGDIEGEPTELLYAHESEFEQVGEKIHEKLGVKSRFTETVQYEKRSGQQFPGETTVFYLRDADGEVVGFIGLIRDVSDRRNRIQQLQVLDRVLRHNLRNDLNVIEGYAEAIPHAAPADAPEYSEQIVRTSKELLGTVSKERQITDFLSESPQVDEIALAETVGTVVAELRDRYPDASISVSVSSACRVRAVQPIYTAIQEVIENALVHSDQDTPTVDVSVTETDGLVDVRVADDGPGISEMERQVLMNGGDIEPLFHGSGLGLWLVNLVVRESDGVLAFESNDPRGSVVVIRLQAA